MWENRPTGNADAVGAINKVLRLLCPGLAVGAGLTRLAGVGRCSVMQKAGAHLQRTRQAGEDGGGSRMHKQSRPVGSRADKLDHLEAGSSRGGERRYWRARED